MARAIWSGSISFGLVNIPIKLYTAVSRKNVTFNQIDTRTNSRVKQKRISEADGTEVPFTDVFTALARDEPYLLLPDGQTLQPIAFRGELTSEYAEETYEELVTKVGEGITGWVAEHRESLLTPDAREVDFASVEEVDTAVRTAWAFVRGAA